MTRACNPNTLRGGGGCADQEDQQFQASLSYVVSAKQPRIQRETQQETVSQRSQGWGSSGAECLPKTCPALAWIPNTKGRKRGEFEKSPTQMEEDCLLTKAEMAVNVSCRALPAVVTRGEQEARRKSRASPGCQGTTALPASQSQPPPLRSVRMSLCCIKPPSSTCGYHHSATECSRYFCY